MTNKETAIHFFKGLIDALEKSGDACITNVETTQHSRTVPDPDCPEFCWIEEPNGERTMRIVLWMRLAEK